MERVLVVDDEPQVLVALEDLLSDDFVVLTAGSAEQALSLVGLESDLAVVVTDQRMPEVTGDQLLARLDGKTNASRVLLTGFAELEAVTRAVNEGKIFAYVPKPWSSSDLLLKVQRAAEHFRLARELELERRLLRPAGHPVIAGLEEQLIDGRHESPLLHKLFAAPAPVVINDIAASGDLHYRDLMLAHGLVSAAVIPLISAGRIDSVFCLFSSKLGFFDNEEVELLCGVADNVSYALEHIGKTEKLNFLAYYDELTRLPNRDLLLERIEQQIAAHGRDGGRFALMVVDIDRFRRVNDTLGRGIGDALLARVAERCREVVADRGTVARVFGDTFALLLPQLGSESAVASFVENELAPALRDS